MALRKLYYHHYYYYYQSVNDSSHNVNEDDQFLLEWQI